MVFAPSNPSALYIHSTPTISGPVLSLLWMHVRVHSEGEGRGERRRRTTQGSRGNRGDQWNGLGMLDWNAEMRTFLALRFGGGRGEGIG